MRNRGLAIALALLAGAALLWFMKSRNPVPTAARSVAIDNSSNSSTPAAPAHISTTPSEPVSTETTPGVPDATPVTPAAAVPAEPKYKTPAAMAESAAGPELAPGLTPATVLENMRGAFHQYSARFGGNPVGTNPEITAALNGGNPRQVVFINPEDGLRINERGELIDNWGTPFFFHQISGTEMEIHSAGPDRKMWTADDLVVK
jgi:hypothetical protein